VSTTRWGSSSPLESVERVVSTNAWSAALLRSTNLERDGADGRRVVHTEQEDLRLVPVVVLLDVDRILGEGRLDPELQRAGVVRRDLERLRMRVSGDAPKKSSRVRVRRQPRAACLSLQSRPSCRSGTPQRSLGRVRRSQS
jgi:hypothetical protein